MAIPTFVAAGTPLEGTTGGTIPWPTHQADDIALLLIETSNDNTVSFTTAAGFVAVTDSPQGSGGSGGVSGETKLWVYWCRATSSAMTDPVIADPGNHQNAVILTFRGCETSGDPWDVTAGDFLATQSTTMTIPGDTTTVNDCLIVAIGCTGRDADGTLFSSWANADLANVTEIYDDLTSLGHGGGFGVATGEKATAGAFGATTATMAFGSQQARLMVALKPPSATSVTGSGSPTVTLSVSASGTGTESFTGSGAPTVSLSTSAAGTGVLTINGNGAPSVTLSVSASGSGDVTNPSTDVSGSGSPSVSLSASASGSGTESMIGSGAPSVTLAVTATGTGSLTITGSGGPSVTLQATGSGTGQHIQNVTGSGAPTVTLSVSASGEGSGGTVVRRGGGFRRILYDPKGAQEEIDARPEWSPDDIPEARPLPEPGPLPEARITEPTEPVRLPRLQKRVEAIIEDDPDEIDFILNVVLDLD